MLYQRTVFLFYSKRNISNIKNLNFNRNQHHFNTYDIALDLEKQSLSKSQAAVLMKGMKFKLRER